MWLSGVKRRRQLLDCLRVFLWNAIFHKAFHFQERNVSIHQLNQYALSFLIQGQSESGGGVGKCWSCCNINEKIEYSPYKRFRNTKKKNGVITERASVEVSCNI